MLRIEFFGSLFIVVGEKTPEQEAALARLSEVFRSLSPFSPEAHGVQVCSTPRYVVDSSVEDASLPAADALAAFRARVGDALVVAINDLAAEAGSPTFLEQYKVVPVEQKKP